MLVLAQVVIPLLLMLAPGLYPAVLLRRGVKSSTLGDALVLSLFADASIAWVPGLSRVPLTLYVGALALVGLLSFALSAPHLLRAARSRAWGIPWIHLATVVSIVIYAAILLTRPFLDYDAGHYYLFESIGFIVSNHFGTVAPQQLTIAPHISYGLPPLLPLLYALSSDAGHTVGITLESSLRLIPLVFLLAAASGIYRLSKALLPTGISAFATLVFVLTPGVIQYMISVPLSLDMAITCITVLFFAELFESRARRSLVILGLIAALATITKITGLPIIVFAAASTYLAWRGGNAARIAVVVAVLAMFAIAELSQGYLPIEGAIIFLAVGAIAYAALRLLKPRRNASVPWRDYAISAAIGVIPAALAVYIQVNGGAQPLSYYVPALTHGSTPNWHWAYSLIQATGLLNLTSPGLPKNYGLGALFYFAWGPVMMAAAIYGCAKLLRSASPVRYRYVALTTFFLLYVSAWLSIFGLQQFSRLLPLTPIVAIFAVAGMANILGRSAALWPSVSTALMLGAPFAWMAQDFFYPSGHPFAWLGWQEWTSWSNTAFLSIIAYQCIIAVVTWRLLARPRSGESAVANVIDARIGLATIALLVALSVGTLLTQDVILELFLPLIGLLLVWTLWRQAPSNAWVQTLAVTAAVFLTFFPFLEATIQPGLAAQAASVENSEEYGFLPALRGATHGLGDGGSILTFADYGISWYTEGRYRAIDMADSIYLGILKPALTSNSPSNTLALLAKNDVRAAVLPNGGNSFADHYYRMRYVSLPGLWTLQDPLLAQTILVDGWQAVRLFPRSSRLGEAAVTFNTSDGRHISLSRPAALSQPRRLLTIKIQTKLPQQAPSLTLLGTSLDDSNDPKQFVTVRAIRLSSSQNESTFALPSAFDKTLTAEQRITINALVFRTSEGTLTGAFTNGGLAMTRSGGEFQVQNLTPALIWHAGDLPLAALLLFNDRNQRATLYPGEVIPEGENDGKYSTRLSWLTRTSRSCPKGAGYTVTFEGIDETGHLAESKPIRTTAGSWSSISLHSLGVSIAPSSPNHNPAFQLTSMSLRSKYRGCKQNMKLDFPWLTFSPDVHDQYQLGPGTQLPVVVGR